MQPDSITPGISGLDGLTDEQVQAIRTRFGALDENDLAWLCRTNRIRDLGELGPSVQSQIARALRTTPWKTRVRTLTHARRAASRVMEALQRDDTALRLAVAGGVRRMERTVERVVLLATAHEPEALLDRFADLSFLSGVERIGPSTLAAALPDGTSVVLEVLPEDPHRFFPRWVELTGSEAHWNALVEHASRMSHRLEPHGLFADETPVACASEPALYERLGLPAVPPERRSTGWIEAPDPALIAIGDMQGLFHVHTDAAAGVFPVGEVARRASHEGYAWVVVADRSPSAFPRGLGTDRLDAQRAAVDDANADPDVEIRVFLGVEARVLADGSLDWPDDALDTVDVVVGVVEDPPGAEATWTSVADRFVAAVTHPRVHVLGHPRVASVGGTHGPPSWDRVLAAAAASDVALELSGESHRMALDLGWHEAARRARVKLVPAADAYDIDGVDNVLAAIGAARRGGWTTPEVLPTLDAAGFRRWLGSR